MNAIEISEIPTILRRNSFWLIVFPVLFAVLALFYVLFKTPVYRTVAEVLIQPDEVRVIANDPMDAIGNQALQGIGLNSQAYVILSSAVLNQVANRLDLDNSPQFVQPGFLSGLFGGLSRTSRSSRDVRADTLNELREIIQVFRLDDSYVFRIRASHAVPELAAAIANETAFSYIEQSRKMKREAVANASSALSRQADQLRSEVEKAEAEVEAYKAQQRLVTTAGGSVLDQQLDALNTQITDARVVLERTKAVYDQSGSITVSDVETGLLPQGPEYAVLNSLRVQYSDIARREAEAATTFGTNHPSLRELRSQLSSIRQQISGELQQIKQSVRSQYEQAQATVNALEQQSLNLQSQNSAQGNALIELRQLQSQANASRDVYEAFLKRARELEELPDLETVTSRVLSEADVPKNPSGPRKILVLAAAATFGAVFAAAASIGLAMLKGIGISDSEVLLRTGAPILANLEWDTISHRQPLSRTKRLRRTSSEGDIAQMRIAYEIENSTAECRPANVVFVSVGKPVNTASFVREVALKLSDTGAETLFAQATNSSYDFATPNEKLRKWMPSEFAGGSERGNPSGPHLECVTLVQDRSRRKKIHNPQQDKPLNSRRKYEMADALDNSEEDYLVVDAGNINQDSTLPIILHHSDAIILIIVLDDLSSSDFERATAYLQPWHDQVIGNVILSGA